MINPSGITWVRKCDIEKCKTFDEPKKIIDNIFNNPKNFFFFFFLLPFFHFEKIQLKLFTDFFWSVSILFYYYIFGGGFVFVVNLSWWH